MTRQGHDVQIPPMFRWQAVDDLTHAEKMLGKSAFSQASGGYDSLEAAGELLNRIEKLVETAEKPSAEDIKQ